MKKLHLLMLATLLLFGFSEAAGQVTADLKVRNQRIEGTNLYFDVYIERTGSNDLYLGHSDFVFTFDHANFSSPTFNYEASSHTLKNTSGNAVTGYTISPTISSNRLIINVQAPTVSTFNTDIAKIDTAVKTHYLGTFYVTGMSNTSTAPNLQWVTSGTGFITKVYTVATSSPYRSTRATVTGVNPTPGTEPTTQPSNLVATNITSSSMVLNWDLGNGSDVIILGKKTSAVGSNTPADGINYAANAAFGSGDEIGTDVFVVYKGSDTTVSVTGLDAGSEYYFAAYAFNGEDGNTENFYLTNPATVNEYTLTEEPTVQATNLEFTAFGTTTLDLRWTSGNGAKHIVLVHKADSVDSDPVDGTTYTANAAFGSGTEIGDSNFVVYAGTDTTVQVTGLDENTMYYFEVFTYNGDGVTSNFLITNPAANNRKTSGAAPTVAASNLEVISQSVNSIGIKWDNGDGERRIVIARESSAVNADPVDGATYTGGAYESGTQVSGTNYVVYDGTDTTTTVTGLDQNKTYYFAVYEYNGTGGGENYLTTTPATGNDNTYLKLLATVNLEGPYNGTDMNTTLNSGGHLPLSQPFNTGPWSYAGSESVGSIPNSDVVDWVLVEVRKETTADSATSSKTKSTKAGFLLKNGSIVDVDGSSPLTMDISESGTFFTVIHHRNHLPVMSADTIAYSGGNSRYEFNFTSAANKAFGTDAQVEIATGVYGMLSGRVETATTPNVINAADRTKVWDDRNTTGYTMSDCTLDGQVDTDDRVAVDNNANAANQVP